LVHDVTLAWFLVPSPVEVGYETAWKHTETVVDEASIYLCSRPLTKGLAFYQAPHMKPAGEWEAIGFQSYEYSSSGNFKVALSPPTELKSRYRCYLPAKVLEKLDAEEEKNGITSLSEWPPIAQERMRNLFS